MSDAFHRFPFILGAHDPEMSEIARFLSSVGASFYYAATNGRRVRREDAYDATELLSPSFSIVRPLPEEAVFVETFVSGILPVLRIDHHNPGDFGFDKLPVDYVLGSSLGQVLSLFSSPPDARQRLFCAADHCLSSAYAALCPMVEPDELLHFRLSWRSKVLRLPLSLVFERFNVSLEIIRAAFSPISGRADFDDPFSLPPEIQEASAYLGIPVCYVDFSFSGDIKRCIKGASYEAILLFMAEHRERGFPVYGNPYRGYAGAYLAGPSYERKILSGQS